VFRIVHWIERLGTGEVVTGMSRASASFETRCCREATLPADA
jgi:hypothetical protein